VKRRRIPNVAATHYDLPMSATQVEPRIARPDQTIPLLVWVAIGAMGAVIIAAAGSVSPTAALAATVALAVIAAVAARPAILPLILVASIYIEAARVEGTTITRVLAPIALLVILVQLIRGRASIRSGPILLWAGAYGLWALASGLWTTSSAGTVFQLSSLSIAVVYMLAFASLIESSRDLERVVWMVVVASAVFAALSLQHVSEALHLRQVFHAGRTQGGIGDPNAFAATQLIAVPLVFALAGQVKKRSLQIGLYVTAVVIIGSILDSLSRGGLIGLAVLLVLLAVVPFRFVFRTRRNKTIALLVVALGVATLSVRYSSEVTRRVQATFNQADPGASSGSGRTYLWLAARTSIEERPLLGLGYGGFRPASNELLLRTPGVDLNVYQIRAGGQPAHSAYIGSLAELGVVGLVLYLSLFIAAGHSLRRAAIPARKARAFFAGSVAGALQLSLVAWAVSSLFLSAETSRAFWIILGIALALPTVIASESDSEASEAVPA
jgi:O-antigen ligase